MLTRRSFVAGAVGLAVFPPRARASVPGAALSESPFVYVSPLRSDGAESTCHGEVWFAWLDGAVALVTSHESWKARALARGLARARIWVGDYGRWKRLGVRNEAFRNGPHFEARARRSRDAALLDRMMEQYRTKYPAEIGKWEPRFREGFASGKRVLLVYAPVA